LPAEHRPQHTAACFRHTWTSKGTSALRSAQQRVDAILPHMLRGIPPAETERLAACSPASP